jgi:ribosomal RNA-processing protein 17
LPVLSSYICLLLHAYLTFLPGDVDSGDDWTGISEKTTGKQKEEEYEDEEVLATVAVVEDFDPDTLIHGPIVKTVPQSAPVAPQTPKRAPVAKKPKPKKVKYQTKDARKAEKGRQRSRRTEKAELAGGKASRKKGPGKKKR